MRYRVVDVYTGRFEAINKQISPLLEAFLIEFGSFRSRFIGGTRAETVKAKEGHVCDRQQRRPEKQSHEAAQGNWKEETKNATSI